MIPDYPTIVQFARSLIVFNLCMGVMGSSSFMIGYLITEQIARRRRKKCQDDEPGINEYR